LLRPISATLCALHLWLSLIGRRKAKEIRSGKPASWRLQDAEVRFSELVRRVWSEEPQRVTVHGGDEVVVMSADEFRRLKGELIGAALTAAMQASPHRDIDIEPKRMPMTVGEVPL
jgi:prevent-host-death family protein